MLQERTCFALIILLALLTAAESFARRQETSQSARVDLFVQQAPLIVGASCKEGVVLVALHTADSDEPLLYYDGFAEDLPVNDDETMLKDLPKDFGGPFRIQKVDEFGTCLVSTGWRADCERLTRACRSLATSEDSTFGTVENRQVFGHYLALELSIALAEQSVIDGRSLSCVSLLATSNNSRPDKASLWLVDAMGAYPVRAHCVGGGSKDGAPVSTTFNTRLCQVDFSDLNCQKAFEKIISLLLGKENADETSALVSSPTRVEAVAIDLKGAFSRIRIPRSQ